MRRTILGGTVPVEALTATGQQDRAIGAFADDEVDRSRRARGEWHGDCLAALAKHHQRAVAAFQSESFDIGADRLGDAQPVQCQQRDQRMFAGAGQAGGDKHRSEFAAVEIGGIGLVVQAGSANVDGG
jgi:hypothetical protein